jgi:hypothetical protein
LIRALSALTALALVGCAPLTGNQDKDTATIATEIVGACLLSPLFKPADLALTAAFPAEATLPIALKNAGVAIVCADPTFYARQDAKTVDWVMKVLGPYIRPSS